MNDSNKTTLFSSLQNPRILFCGATEIMSRSTELRSRPFWRFHWNSTPGAWFNWQGEKLMMGPNRLIAVPPHVKISQGCSSPCHHVFMQIDGGLIFNSCKKVLWVDTQANGLLSVLQNIEAKLKKSGRTAPENIDFFLSQKIKAVVNRVFAELEPNDLLQIKPDSRIAKAILLIEESLQYGMSNEQLADKVHLSTNAFIRLFTQKVGMAPQQFLMKQRLQQAALRLTTTSASIDQIATDVGFCERSYFSRIFKREFQISPAQFRKISLEDS